MTLTTMDMVALAGVVFGALMFAYRAGFRAGLRAAAARREPSPPEPFHQHLDEQDLEVMKIDREADEA